MTEEFNEQNNEENVEEKDVELMEFSLIDDEIDELIAKLQLLKETKEQISFEVDDENEFVIHYEESSESNNESNENSGEEEDEE